MQLMNMLKSKNPKFIVMNIIGIVTGMVVMFSAACMIRRYLMNRNSLRSRARKAFRTMGDKIPL
ncbi:MAG: hypothetical protein A2Y15_04455 [Clostridiales bacterium GWF2_36_10]|nr:MAG: hypothetical protein A2Y15_04455 [Clostridiales bacterium GWF2_36_10]HAN20663.1 hypothetical protein [Clostridiales bacterium]